MDIEVKEQWLTALRSGRYKQGRMMLRSNDEKYCCLGVLCDILGAKWEASNLDTCYYIDGGYSAMPNVELGMQAGLDFTDIQELASRNDSGQSFHMIADWIEENL